MEGWNDQSDQVVDHSNSCAFSIRVYHDLVRILINTDVGTDNHDKCIFC